jgi:GNAT superfamily N-acetyltransferase
MTRFAANAAPLDLDGFEPCHARHKGGCLALFDANCPTYFAANERADYEAFLDDLDGNYWVRLQGSTAIAAFGLTDGARIGHLSLNWIMVHPEFHGGGLGRSIMTAVEMHARAAGAELVDIAASHLSAPFFARFGAREVGQIADGWGPAMHRVDMELRLPE